MSASLNNGTLRSLTRTPQQQQSSSSSSMNDSGSSVIDTIRKRMQQIKDELAKSHDDLHAYQIEREREKHAREQAEGEIGGVTRRIQLVEEDLERTEERLSQATQKLDEASHAADESERGRKTLEQRTYQSDERIGTLEQQLAEAQLIAEDSDRKYDEVARRIAVMEVDLERAEDRAEAAEAKALELEEELKVVGNNMKSLEVSEQEALQREESYEEQIRDLSTRLKDAEQRADLAERTMAKLQKEVDRLEGWKSLTYYDRSLLQQLNTCLQSCLSVTSDNAFLNIVINRRPQAFDMFEYISLHLFKQWKHQNRSLINEQLDYLTTVGRFNRRITLTLQNDNDDPVSIEEDNEQKENNLEHQKRVQELLFKDDNELFNILMEILPIVSENELDFIEMILPWYESYIFFEHSYIDAILDEKFRYLNQQIIQCLKSNEYERSLFVIDNNQPMVITVRHRFYLCICTMAMGTHVNCDDNECEEAKNLLELYLSRYNIFIHFFLNENQINSLNSLACVTGIVTYLVNYTLIIDNDNNQQLLFDLFLIILHENFYKNIRLNWSTYETILIDSIICYLIIYCFNNRLLIHQFLRLDDNYIKKLQNLIDIAQKYGNRRIAIMSQLFLLILTSCTKNNDLSQTLFLQSIMSQLFLLILTSCTKNNDLSQTLFLQCITYIQISLENIHSYHYNRIPMSMFFKSIIHIMKCEHIQEIIAKHYLNLFTNIIIWYEKNNLYENIIYYESTMIILTILWSLSFNESCKKNLKETDQDFFNIILNINTTTNESSVKQATCGLLYNLDILDVSQVTQKYGNRRIAIMSQLFLLILTSCTKNNDLSQTLFLQCITYIQISLENIHSYHYNRIPMSMFFKSIIHIMKCEHIQEIIAKHYLNLFTNIIILYEKNNLYENIIYYESTMIILTILWSLSFNENCKKNLKETDQDFFNIILNINTTTNESSVKQATCGLLYNLDILDVSQSISTTGDNFGKTIGISYDPSDYEIVQMIEQELNKNGHRVWTTYDHMNDHFIPSFISVMNGTEYLIICLSDIYRVNNRCRTELLYATASGRRVLSWKVQALTDNQEENEQIRIRAIETLLKRITPNESDNTQTIDTAHVNINVERRSTPTNFNRRRRTKEIMSLENWTNTEVLTWCQGIDLPGFLKLLANFDGQSVVKLYDFCKQNSTETIAVLNNDLHNVCKQENISDIQISVHEFIRFQLEVEKVLSTTNILENSSISLASSKPDRYKKRSKIRTCSIL
ncbi:unnamed protein product [Adineta steineri]|uniref:TIR domain-containing protein n=1 Tax=Adineta steineri TaxID=433720 RepID=A0A815R895_9BILA|nr:unnamed protein product [Adineta steineri]